VLTPLNLSLFGNKYDSKSHTMRLIRFGVETYSRMLLTAQTALMGLKDWEQILSPEEKKSLETLVGVDRRQSEEYDQAKSKWWW